VHGGERLAHLGLADARLALEQQRPLEKIHQPQRGRNVAIGDIADGSEFVRDLVAARVHQGSDNALFVLRRVGGWVSYSPFAPLGLPLPGGERGGVRGFVT
jgi:hypothetical protein